MGTLCLFTKTRYGCLHCSVGMTGERIFTRSPCRGEGVVGSGPPMHQLPPPPQVIICRRSRTPPSTTCDDAHPFNPSTDGGGGGGGGCSSVPVFGVESELLF